MSQLLRCIGSEPILSLVRLTALLDTEYNALLSRSNVLCRLDLIFDCLSNLCCLHAICLAEPNSNTSHGSDLTMTVSTLDLGYYQLSLSFVIFSIHSIECWISYVVISTILFTVT